MRRGPAKCRSSGAAPAARSPRPAIRCSPRWPSAAGCPMPTAGRASKPRSPRASRAWCAPPRAACPMRSDSRPRPMPPISARPTPAPRPGRRPRAAGWPRRTGWRRSRAPIPTPPSRCCRRWRRRCSSPTPSATACCTRSRCGRWRPTTTAARAGSRPCPKPPGTSACTSGAYARPWRGRTGARRWPASNAWAARSVRSHAGAISKPVCAN